MSEHSKLPWEVSGDLGQLVTRANGNIIVTACGTNEHTAFDTAQANAAFIVQACNNFDALRKALERMLSLYRPNHHGQTCGFHLPNGNCDCLFGEARGILILAATIPASAPEGASK